MKQAIIILSMLTLFFAYACKKDDTKKTDSNNYYQLLQGTWYQDTVDSEAIINGVSNGQLHAVLHATGPERFVFRKDGTMDYKNDVSNEPLYTYKYNYDPALQRITFTDNGKAKFFTIKELNETRLVLTLDDTQTTDNRTRRIIYRWTCRKAP